MIEAVNPAVSGFSCLNIDDLDSLSLDVAVSNHPAPEIRWEDEADKLPLRSRLPSSPFDFTCHGSCAITGLSCCTA